MCVCIYIYTCTLIYRVNPMNPLAISCRCCTKTGGKENGLTIYCAILIAKYNGGRCDKGGVCWQ